MVGTTWWGDWNTLYSPPFPRLYCVDGSVITTRCPPAMIRPAVLAGFRFAEIGDFFTTIHHHILGSSNSILPASHLLYQSCINPTIRHNVSLTSLYLQLQIFLMGLWQSPGPYTAPTFISPLKSPLIHFIFFVLPRV